MAEQAPLDHKRPRQGRVSALQPVAQRRVGRLDVLQAQLDESPRRHAVAQLQAASPEAAPAAVPGRVGPVPNRTGLPDQLKAGIERLSGIAMDNVRVHYGSSQPAQLNAHAFAQGADIHLAPGQAHHLPHEAWHVVQQAQGRVRPTQQLQAKNVSINDDAHLEREADIMGARAMRGIAAAPVSAALDHRAAPTAVLQPMRRAGGSLLGSMPRGSGGGGGKPPSRPFSFDELRKKQAEAQAAAARQRAEREAQQRQRQERQRQIQEQQRRLREQQSRFQEEQRRIDAQQRQLQQQRERAEEEARARRALAANLKRMAALLAPQRSSLASAHLDESPVNSSTEGAESGTTLYRSDDYPFHDIQPKYGTFKSVLRSDSVLHPVDPNGPTTPALHVHGKPEDKAKSPYTSTSTKVESASPYGKNLIEIHALPGEFLGQPEIQSDLIKSRDPRLAETAVNVTQPGKPKWQPPTAAHKASAIHLGLPPDGSDYTYRQRGQINSLTDNEALVKGLALNTQFWHFIPAKKFLPKVNWGSGSGQVDFSKIPALKERDKRTLHPEGYRIPVNDYGVEFLHRRAQQRHEQEEIERERKEDEDIRSGRVTEEQLAQQPVSTLGRVAPVVARRGGASPGREAQYEALVNRLKKKAAKGKNKKTTE